MSEVPLYGRPGLAASRLSQPSFGSINFTDLENCETDSKVSGLFPAPWPDLFRTFPEPIRLGDFGVVGSGDSGVGGALRKRLGETNLSTERKRVNLRIVVNPSEAAHLPDQHSQISALGDLIAVSTYDQCSVGPPIQPICTRCCLTMTEMIKV